MSLYFPPATFPGSGIQGEKGATQSFKKRQIAQAVDWKFASSRVSDA